MYRRLFILLARFVKWLCFVVSACTACLFLLALYVSTLLPDTIKVAQGGTVAVAGMPFLLSAVRGGASTVASVREGSSYNASLTLGGFVPVKTVRAQVVSRRSVQVCGTPFGIKMFSNGAMVVGFSDIYTSAGSQNPAKTAGLALGDVILSIAGCQTKTNEDVAAALQGLQGSPAEVVYMRRETESRTVLTAVLDGTTGTWRTGMWVRDSSAGIGTLTFVDPATSTFAGLGHSIHDTDTGTTISLLKGEIVDVEITGCTAGSAGSPGELQGRFLSSVPTGTITVNGETGVYGQATGYFRGFEAEVAYAQEITTGEAQIYTTINGQTPQFYSVEIEKIALENCPQLRQPQPQYGDPRDG